jgi:small-conductance mechanosensitive channel
MTNDTPATRIGLVWTSIAATLVTLPAIAIAWSLLAWWPTLPDEVPSQWSGNEVISRLPTYIFASAAVLIAGAAAAFAWHAALSPDGYERHSRVFLISGSVAIMPAVMWLISATVVRNPDQGIGAAGLLVISAPLYGLLPFAFALKNPPARGANEPVVLEARSTETFVWSQTQFVPSFAWATPVCVLAAIVFGYLPMTLAGPETSNVSSAIVMSILAVMFYAGARVTVTVDPQGLRARSATVGVRFVSVRLAEASSARVTILEPLRWGGWGYRLSSRGKALVLRGGPAIVVTLQSGAEVTVTTPDAEQAVSVFRALQERDLRPPRAK